MISGTVSFTSELSLLPSHMCFAPQDDGFGRIAEACANIIPRRATNAHATGVECDLRAKVCVQINVMAFLLFVGNENASL